MVFDDWYVFTGLALCDWEKTADAASGMFIVWVHLSGVSLTGMLR